MTPLYYVVHHQRRQYKKFMTGKPAHITQERIDQLNALGFNWTPRGELNALASARNESEKKDALGTPAATECTTTAPIPVASATTITDHATTSASLAAGMMAATTTSSSTTTAAATATVEPLHTKSTTAVDSVDPVGERGVETMASRERNDQDEDEKSPKRLKTCHDEFEFAIERV